MIEYDCKIVKIVIAFIFILCNAIPADEGGDRRHITIARNAAAYQPRSNEQAKLRPAVADVQNQVDLYRRLALDSRHRAG